MISVSHNILLEFVRLKFTGLRIFSFLRLYDILSVEVVDMTAVQYKRRIAAVKTADAINAIEGMPVSRVCPSAFQQLGKRGDQRRADEGGASGLPRKAGPHRCGTVVDPYCYEDTPILRNTLDIRDEKTLDLIEAEQSRANMMLLYEQGFHDFTPEGLRNIHRFLFGDIYQWAGEYRDHQYRKAGKAACGPQRVVQQR